MQSFRRSLRRSFIYLLLGAVASVSAVATPSTAFAHEFVAGDLKVLHPNTRATPPGAKVAGGFLVIENKGVSADKLLSASSAVSKTVELHSMSMDGGIMRMRQVDAIDVPAKGKVELKSGGLHIMFIDIKEPLKQGDKFPVTLKFEKAGDVKVEMMVDKMSGGSHNH